MTTLATRRRRDERTPVVDENRLRFTLREFGGGLGDLGTFLPLAAAMAIANRMDLSVVFLFAGLMNITTGLLFRQPIPVQPMKAIAAVAIAEGLSPGSIAASGMVMGVVMALLALTGTASWIDRVVPRPVIRGIQAGVGATLVLRGMSWIVALPPVGIDSWLMAVILGVAVALTVSRTIPIILIVFIGGLAVAALRDGGAAMNLSLKTPTLGLVRPAGSEWITGLTRGALPQLPLTVLNSVLAVCALSGDLFPGRGVSPRRMALSVGMMNLLCVPFGAMPMCHGSGGLAAQHRFGARSGGSVIMLGVGMVLCAFALGVALLPLIRGFPRSALAVMIIAAGLSLMKPARESLRSSPNGVVMLATAGAIVAVGTLEGVAAGCAVLFILKIAAHWPGRQR